MKSIAKPLSILLPIVMIISVFTAIPITAATGEYTVRFVNGSTELQSDTLAYDSPVAYTGEEPTKATDEYFSYTWSGWTDGVNTYGTADALPAVSGDVTYTATFDHTSTKLFEIYSITLDGDIGVNFYVAPDAIGVDVSQTESAVVNLDWTYGSTTVDLKTLTPDACTGWYRVTAPLPVAQMVTPVTATVVIDGETVKNSQGEAITDTHSVREYAEKTIEAIINKEDNATEKEEQLKTLMMETLNYGAMAQHYFGDVKEQHNVNTQTYADKKLGDYGYDAYVMYNVSVDDLQRAIDSYEPNRIIPEDQLDLNAAAASFGAKWFSVSLLFRSTSTLRIYFIEDPEATDPPFDKYYFYGDENERGSRDDCFFYVQKKNIAAADLEVRHRFNVGGNNFYFSALDYGIMALNREDMNENAQNLIRAMYLYNQAANDYFPEPEEE